MRFFLDQSISPKTKSFLCDMGHNVVRPKDFNLEKATDEEILKLAIQQDRIIVTFDLDFSDVRKLSRLKPPGIIIFRTKSFRSEVINSLLKILFARHKSSEIIGKLIIIDESKIRMRIL